MTADDVLNALNNSEAAATAYTHLVEGVKVDDLVAVAMNIADLCGIVTKPAQIEAEDHMDDLTLAIAQTVEALERLVKEVESGLTDVTLTIDNARKFAQHARELWSKR